MLRGLMRGLRGGVPGTFGSMGRQDERRGALRHDVQFNVHLRRPGISPVAGSVINISWSGAAIRVHGWNAPTPAAWPTRLSHGDELWITGLLDSPLLCWVVTVDDGVLRVHYTLNEPMRDQLQEKIAA